VAEIRTESALRYERAEVEKACIWRKRHKRPDGCGSIFRTARYSFHASMDT
jgi:hypothetical protein